MGSSWGKGREYHLPRYIYVGLVLVLPKKKKKSKNNVIISIPIALTSIVKQYWPFDHEQVI